MLEPSGDPRSSLIDGTGLMGTGARLNGELLALGPGGAVPSIMGAAVGAMNITVPKTSIAFLVLGGARHAACM